MLWQIAKSRGKEVRRMSNRLYFVSYIDHTCVPGGILRLRG